MNSWIPEDALKRVESARVASYWDGTRARGRNLARIAYRPRQHNGLAGAGDGAAPQGRRRPVSD